MIFKLKPQLSVMWVVLGQPCTGIFTPILASVARLNITGIKYWSNGDAWRNCELIGNYVYGAWSSHDGNAELKEKIMTFHLEIERLLVDFIESLWFHFHEQ